MADVIEPSQDYSAPNPPRRAGLAARLGRRLGAAAFLFFLVKGLVWLGVLTLGGRAVLAGW